MTQVALSFGKHKVCLGTAGSGGLRLANLAPVTDMGEFGRVEHEHLASPVVGSPLRRVSCFYRTSLARVTKNRWASRSVSIPTSFGSSTARMTFAWWTAIPAGSLSTSFTSSSQRPPRSRDIGRPWPERRPSLLSVPLWRPAKHYQLASQSISDEDMIQKEPHPRC